MSDQTEKIDNTPIPTTSPTPPAFPLAEKVISEKPKAKKKSKEVKTSKTETSTETLITIQSLDELKKELKVDGLDTSSITDFKQINITTVELTKFKKSLDWIPDQEKLEKCKIFIKEKVVIQIKTEKKTSELQNQIEWFPLTAEWMKKAFIAVKEAWVPDIESEKEESISLILNKFIYYRNSWLHITNDSGIFKKDLKVIDKDWKEIKEYSDVLKECLTENEFNFDLAYRTTIWNKWECMAERVDEIVCKYNENREPKDRINMNESNLPVLLSQISNSCLEQDQKVLLMSYVRDPEKYKKIDVRLNKRRAVADNKLHAKGPNWEESTAEEFERKTKMKLDRHQMAEIVRNPLWMAWRLLWSMNPISAMALIASVIWGIFWKPSGSTFWKVLMTIAWYWVVEWFGWVKWIADSIEGKHDGDIAEWASKSWKWASEVADTIGHKISWSVEELIKRIEFFYNFRDYKFADVNWIAKDVIDSDFTSLHNACAQWNPKITKNDWKWTNADATKLREKINETYAKWKEKYKDGFDGMIVWKSVKEVIDIVTDNPPKNSATTQNSPVVALSNNQVWAATVWAAWVAAAAPSGAPTNAPAAASRMSKEDLNSQKESWKDQILASKWWLLSAIDKCDHGQVSLNLIDLKTVLKNKIDSFYTSFGTISDQKVLASRKLDFDLYQIDVWRRIAIIESNIWCNYVYDKQMAYINDLTKFISSNDINNYINRAIWTYDISHYTSLMWNFDLDWMDLTQDQTEVNSVYIAYQDKMTGLLWKIPSSEQEVYKKQYKEYLFFESKLQLQTLNANSWRLFHKLKLKHIDALNLKTFADWKAEIYQG